MNIRLALILLSALTFVACGEKASREQPADSTAAAAQEEAKQLAQIADPDTSGTGRWTANTRSSRRAIEEVSLLTNVRTSSSPAYERIVFDFATSLPNWHIEYIDKPVRSCGSGDVVDIAGQNFLEIRFTPTNAHDTAGHPTMAWREKQFSYRNLLEIEQTCDFEAVTTWVAGVRSPSQYRVMELQNPPRIVIDLKNQ
jgi:hypothetical protein